MNKKRIVIIGSTGSVGTQTLEVVRKNMSSFEVVGLAAGNNLDMLRQQVQEFSVEGYYSLGQNYSCYSSLLEMVQDLDFDLLVAAASGIASYDAVCETLRRGIPTALANKEIIVSYGEELQRLCGGAPAVLDAPLVLPVDSEHSGLFQCLRGEDVKSIRRVIITASGGALRDKDFRDTHDVTPEDVLRHPTWSMGKKVTVDSATLVNKAFEAIEAHYLFGIPLEKIEVRLHRQSRVHAIVDFIDGNSKLVVSHPDMTIPLQYALFYPDRVQADYPYFDYDEDLHFERLDRGRFPCFDLVMDCAHTKPRNLKKLVEKDDEAVGKFLSGEISFPDIHSYLSSCL